MFTIIARALFYRIEEMLFNFKKRLKKGLSEVDLVEIFYDEIKKIGAKTASFTPIIALDENSASTHYSIADKNKILTGENILLIEPLKSLDFSGTPLFLPIGLAIL